MNDEEVEIVAAELAKVGGTSWYPGRENGPVLRVITERYRDRARAAIAALERYRASQGSNAQPPLKEQADPVTPASFLTTSSMRKGATVIYRPPGDRRAYPCTIERVADDFVYLVPQAQKPVGWVAAADIWTNPNFLSDLRGEEEKLASESPRG